MTVSRLLKAFCIVRLKNYIVQIYYNPDAGFSQRWDWNFQ